MNENKATIAYYIFKNQHKIDKRRKHLKEGEGRQRGRGQNEMKK